MPDSRLETPGTHTRPLPSCKAQGWPPRARLDSSHQFGARSGAVSGLTAGYPRRRHCLHRFSFETPITGFVGRN